MLRGLLPPIPTPFVDGELSTPRLRENLARWNDLPLDGYLVLGSNGEAPLLDDAERSEVIRAARAVIPHGVPMVVGTGRESTRAAIRATNEAFDLGATAALVGVPCYFRPAMSDQALREHYLRVADASPGPVLLYSVPFFTGLPIGAPLFRELLAHERIAGIKDSSGAAASLRAMVEAARGSGREAAVLIGNASLLAEGLRLGASGAVLAVGCIAARACSEIARLARVGQHEEAARRNRLLIPLAEAVTLAHGIGGLKAALDFLDLNGGDPRPPLLPAGPEARAEIAALMKEIGLLS